MKHLLFLPALLLALLTMVGLSTQCTGDIMTEATPQLVVEGVIDDGGFPVVIVTLTLPISTEEHSIEEIKDHIVRWAKVTISDGERTEVMMGRYHEGYLPPYIYTTTEMRGEAGRSYTIQVDYRDYHATATTTIPRTVVPDSIVMRPVKERGFLDSLVGNSQHDAPPYAFYQAYICTHEDRTTKDYYAAFSRVGDSQRQFLLSQLSVLDDATMAEVAEIPVYQGHITDDKEYERNFPYGERVGIKFARIDSVSYHILKSYEDNMLFSDIMFIQSTNSILSNIEGGLGFWIGCGASFAYFQTGMP